jgi:CDP-diacylglycerol--serine O-phosphatidyltransferase
MAAGIVASSVLAFQDLQVEASGNIWLLAMTYLLAFVMVSTFRYRSFKDLDLKERLPFRYLIFGVMIIAVVAYRPEVNLFILFLTYAILGAVFGILNFGKNKRIRANVYNPSQEPSEDPDLVEEDDEDDKKS